MYWYFRVWFVGSAFLWNVTSVGISKDFLEYTPEEVLKAYQVKKEDTNLYEEQGRNAAFVLENQEVFGETAQTVMFSFMDMELGEEKISKSWMRERRRRKTSLRSNRHLSSGCRYG